MKYKMLVLDMDGTLLTNDKKLSDRNREALEKAAKKGVKIVVSTGRIFTSAILYGEMLGVSTPIIASNGAYIREKDRDEVVFSVPLGEKNAREIIRRVKIHNLDFHIISNDVIYAEKIIYTSLNHTRWNKDLPENRQVSIQMVEGHEWDEIINENKSNILKAIISDEDPEKLLSMRKDLKDLDVEIASSAHNNIEVMNKGVSKGKAVEVLAKYYNLSREEIICMGDNENDISMIEYAGLGIAMGNATDEAKKAANFVTLSNQEDGVAYAIEKFILAD